MNIINLPMMVTLYFISVVRTSSAAAADRRYRMAHRDDAARCHPGCRRLFLRVRGSPLFTGVGPVTSFLPPLAPYPQTRLRRNRRDPWSRKLVAETILTAGDLIWPVFVHDEGHKEPIPSMPGVFRLPIPALVDAAGEAAELGIPVVAVFPAVPSALKDGEGSNALDPGNLVCRAVAALKKAVPELGVLCDVALDP